MRAIVKIGGIVTFYLFALAACGGGGGSGNGLDNGGGGSGNGPGLNSGIGGVGTANFQGFVTSINFNSSSLCDFATLIIRTPDKSTKVLTISAPRGNSFPACIAKQVFRVSPDISAVVVGAQVRGTFDQFGSENAIRTIEVIANASGHGS